MIKTSDFKQGSIYLIPDRIGLTLQVQGIQGSPTLGSLEFIKYANTELIYIESVVAEEQVLHRYYNKRTLAKEEIPIEDLPLYIHWKWKGPLFYSLLRGDKIEPYTVERIARELQRDNLENNKRNSHVILLNDNLEKEVTAALTDKTI